MKLNNNEIILKEGAANHLKAIEGVGGKLYLNNQRLIFESHSLNVQTHVESIPLSSIVSIQTKYSDFISRKLLVSLRNGAKEKYYVYKRKNWVKEIKKAIENII